MGRTVSSTAVLLLLSSLCSCSSEDVPAEQPPGSDACSAGASMLAAGDPDGHADPFGARAAGQARAGRVSDGSLIVQPANERQRIEVGDFVLANEHLAVYVEDKDLSSGYARFGGEILSVDQVGDDGRPMGLSRYGETLMALSNEMIQPDSVTVLRDGSDGGPAVLRVLGRLQAIPFLEGSLGVLFPREYRMPAAFDYVLEPGAENLRIRLQFVNETPEPMDLSMDEMYGFFHYNRSDMVTAEYGYGEPKKTVGWVGYDGGPLGFAWRTAGRSLWYGLTQSGFSHYAGDGFTVDACTAIERDHAELIAGGPELDGLREAIRRVDGEPAWRAIAGTVKDGAGAPVAGAWVIEVGADGKVVSRTRADASGAFTIHAPDETVKLVPIEQGLPSHAGTEVAPGQSQVELSFAAHGTIRVTAVEQGTTTPIPVRIHVRPAGGNPASPDEYGMKEERGGKLHQVFSLGGDAELRVPPGEHQVIVSHGPAWEIEDTSVTVAAGETKTIAAELAKTVDTGRYLCTDFHEHTWMSADSQDPVEYKVAGGVADGLAIPVFSDHEWVTDPQPTVEKLGLASTAFGLTSSELTTFTWGHFGVIPMTSHPDEPNGGAVDWIGKDPAEVFALVDALPEKPLLIVNHPRGGGFGAYFDAAAYKRDTGKGSALYSDNFDAIEVCNGSSLQSNREDSAADWFSFLNHGKDIWAVGSSDNHHLQSGAVGYPRTCLYFDDPDPPKLTPSLVRDALGSGGAFVSGGIWLDVKGPGGERPGQTALVAGQTATFTVVVAAPSWIPVDTLEVIVNGETAETRTLDDPGAGPGKAFTEQVDIALEPSTPRTWVVFHATGPGDLAPVYPGRSPFAFSNPVFLTAQ